MSNNLKTWWWRLKVIYTKNKVDSMNISKVNLATNDNSDTRSSISSIFHITTTTTTHIRQQNFHPWHPLFFLYDSPKHLKEKSNIISVYIPCQDIFIYLTCSQLFMYVIVWVTASSKPKETKKGVLTQHVINPRGDCRSLK